LGFGVHPGIKETWVSSRAHQSPPTAVGNVELPVREPGPPPEAEDSWNERGKSRTPTDYPTFCDTALAQRIERAKAQLIAKGNEAAHHRAVSSAGFVIPIASGVGSFAEKGSPLNKVGRLGLDGVPTAAALEEIEQAFTAHGAPMQIELAPLADPAIGALLTKGLWADIVRKLARPSPAGPTPARHTTQDQGPAQPQRQLEPWLHIGANGFAHPDNHEGALPRQGDTGSAP
jgi:hypothetical protein